MMNYSKILKYNSDQNSNVHPPVNRQCTNALTTLLPQATYLCPTSPRRQNGSNWTMTLYQWSLLLKQQLVECGPRRSQTCSLLLKQRLVECGPRRSQTCSSRRQETESLSCSSSTLKGKIIPPGLIQKKAITPFVWWEYTPDMTNFEFLKFEFKEIHCKVGRAGPLVLFAHPLITRVTSICCCTSGFSLVHTPLAVVLRAGFTGTTSLSSLTCFAALDWLAAACLVVE